MQANETASGTLENLEEPKGAFGNYGQLCNATPYRILGNLRKPEKAQNDVEFPVDHIRTA